MKKSNQQTKRDDAQTEKDEKQKQQHTARYRESLKEVLKRLFSRRLDKPGSTADDELWMKLKK